ncbi:MAG TPA: lipopolysaccharide kinase InaA family protein [Pseudomonas sp.]|uniref:lipopolysaccharide kinase InaA family protein n=1 Tax=Pseudomonas sp. TaxID=306 RepID=UPI002C6B3803|nr:lipopolysaccharide kinase InaA family protein [Pseudomonas sp.]HSX88966.1 lipopolysaccharide kinase InaA family protein [Pseudomonas sp.]
MRIVTANELQDWLSTGEVLEKDGKGPKVLRLPQGNILKIFRSRRYLPLARWRPDALRFAKHAARLQALGISTPAIKECCWIDHTQAISACLYAPLQGTSLDKLFLSSRLDFDALLPRLASYICHLHQLGIYFRSLHLGNVLLTADGNFGLIDFLDMRFKRRPLGSRMVRRNFQHMHSYLLRRKFQGFPWEQLMEHYAHARKASN